MKTKTAWFLGILLITLSLLTRIVLAPKFFHGDLICNAAWGEYVANTGAKTFFENNVWTYSWPTQLPLINLVYGFCFNMARYLIIDLMRFGFLMQKLGLNSWVQPGYENFLTWFQQPIVWDNPFKIDFIFSIKILPILADLVIAMVIWVLARKNKSKAAIVWPVVYLWSPFSIYLSAIWGQYDQVSFLMLLLAILSLDKLQFLSPILFSLSLGIKPTSAIFIPFYLYLMIKRRNKWKQFGLGVILAIVLNYWMLWQFAVDGNVFKLITNRIIPAVIYKSEPRISVNSYNFWHMIAGDVSVNQGTNFLFMPFRYWGILALIILNWWAIRFDMQSKNRTFLALAIIGIGSWLFGMNMLERYLFGGVGFLLITAMNKKGLVPVWVILSVLFLFNLANGWWQPEILGFLEDFHDNWPTWSRFTFPVINVGLFFWLVKKAREV